MKKLSVRPFWIFVLWLFWGLCGLMQFGSWLTSQENLTGIAWLHHDFAAVLIWCLPFLIIGCLASIHLQHHALLTHTAGLFVLSSLLLLAGLCIPYKPLSALASLHVLLCLLGCGLWILLWLLPGLYPAFYDPLCVRLSRKLLALSGICAVLCAFAGCISLAGELLFAWGAAGICLQGVYKSRHKQKNA